MSSNIIRTKAGDLDRLMNLMETAFDHEPGRFRKSLPRLYKPTDEHMGCHFAIEEDGDLIASLGVYPMQLRVGETVLKLAGIGGVSTHPDARGKGCMKTLMNHAKSFIAAEGFDLSYLGGQRQRYRYFGWERCGLRYFAHFTKTNLRHSFGDVKPIELKPLEQNPSDEVIAKLQHIHQDAPIATIRPKEFFRDWLANWQSDAFVAYDEAGEVVGYVAHTARNEFISEIAGINEEIETRILASTLDVVSQESGLFLFTPMRTRMLQVIEPHAEYFRLESSGNWQVFDWVKTIDALLKVRAKDVALIDGRVGIAIEGSDGIELTVEQGRATCAPLAGKAELTLDAPTATRLLCGPLRPSSVIPLPSNAAVLDQWCPLPLCMSRLDCV